MRDDLIDRLTRENPVPEELAPLPIDDVLERLQPLPGPPPVPPHRARTPLRGAVQPLPIVLSLALVAAVSVVVITGGPHARSSISTARHGGTSAGRSQTKLDRTIERLAASQFAVFARPQTTRDRSMPALVRRASRLGRLGPGAASSALDGTIPSLTRYTQTISGGREVFLAVIRPQALLPPRARHRRALLRNADRFLTIRVLIVQPEGRWTDGQPLVDPTGGQGCLEDTYWHVVPNRVARILWQFGRQDRLGYVYSRALDVSMVAHGNLAVATIPQRASCDRPTTVTLYGRHGQVLSHTGDAADLDRITRPVKHGSPFGYKALQRRAARDARRR